MRADIDECKVPELAAKCVENAECCNLPAHYVCKCKAGFEGDGESECTGTNILPHHKLGNYVIFVCLDNLFKCKSLQILTSVYAQTPADIMPYVKICQEIILVLAQADTKAILTMGYIIISLIYLCGTRRYSNDTNCV